jgi:hypothetical protein
MASRPCKPDADLKHLWRTLLGTPFPACGVADADTQDRVEVEKSAKDTSEPSAKISASGA